MKQIGQRPAKQRSLFRNLRGGTDFIEKIVLIGLFVFVAALGVQYIGKKVHTKFESQGDAIESEVHDGLASESGGQ